MPFVDVGTRQVQVASGDDGTYGTGSCIVPGYVHNTLFVETKIHPGFVAGELVLVPATSLRSCLDMHRLQLKRFVGVVFLPGIEFLRQVI